ncbi:MAG: PilZ domain-containing protein [Candidatus Omnitrophota bacterium]
MITSEKRAFKRTDLEFKVTYRSGEKNSKKKGAAISKNISLGGVYFSSLDIFSIGDILEISVETRDRKTKCEWKARVVRCEKTNEKIIDTFGVAAEFIDPSENSVKKLKEALKGNI